LPLVNFVFTMGARAITRLLLGFFEVVPTCGSLPCALVSTNEELIREIWVHTPDEVRVRYVGASLAVAAELQLEAPFRWLLGLANGASLDEAVELMVGNRLVGALCKIEATGFDLTRTRPARALASWNRTMSLVATPTPSLPSVHTATLLAWHVGVLRDWDIPCDEPKALASRGVIWAESGPADDFSSLTKSLHKRVLFLAQLQGGVMLGLFANLPLVGRFGRDRALKSAIFVLEHPTGEQRKWQLQKPSYRVRLDGKRVYFGKGLSVYAAGGVWIRSAPEFGMREDASFISLKPADGGGWSFACIDRWELWSV
jgi:hypothetical protein